MLVNLAMVQRIKTPKINLQMVKYPAKKEQRLKKHGYHTQKGKFGWVKKGSKSHTRKRKSKRR